MSCSNIIGFTGFVDFGDIASEGGAAFDVGGAPGGGGGGEAGIGGLGGQAGSSPWAFMTASARDFRRLASALGIYFRFSCLVSNGATPA